MNIKFNQEVNLTQVEKPQPVKKRYWDRWVYLGILILLVFSFFSWLITPWFFHSAEGILLQEQYDVKFTNDIRVLKYKVSEDQEVKIGDTLFYYEKYTENWNVNNPIQDSIQILLKNSQSNDELIALEAQIEKRRLFLIDLKKRLNYWNSERTRKEKLVYLNAITPNELANVDRSIDDVSYEIATISTEYKVLIQQLQKLRKDQNDVLNLNKTSYSINRQALVFTAPFAGQINKLDVPENQVCYKTDKVTSILRPSYYVKAYIEVSDLNGFNIGDDVIVTLPYGSEKLAGKVKKIYALSEVKNEVVFYKSFNEYKHGVVVEIVPANPKGWDKLKVSNLPVKVRKGIINV